MMQGELFGDDFTDKELITMNAAKIKGLKINLDFLSPEEELSLLAKIDEGKWILDLKRRVQHYGFRYDYKSRKIDNSYFLGPLPDWLTDLTKKLFNERIINVDLDQAIINEYINDQGIAPHIDCEPCFGDTIISISLGGPCIMNFESVNPGKPKSKIDILLPARTLVVISGESRYEWLHSIPGRKNDKFNGKIYRRNRRVSITFRKVLI